MSTQTFVLPDVGEGLTEAEIVTWKVAPGDDVAVNDVIVEIETAKSLVELPSPFAGTVGELLAPEGATVEVGAPIITIAAEAQAADVEVGRSAHGEPDRGTDTGGAVLVGYGTGGAVQSRRRAPAERPVASSVGVVARPPIRKLARDLGVDLTAVAPSGEAGEVTREDVMRHAEQASVFRNLQTPQWSDVREETIAVAPEVARSSVAPVRAEGDSRLAPAAGTAGADAGADSAPDSGSDSGEGGSWPAAPERSAAPAASAGTAAPAASAPVAPAGAAAPAVSDTPSRLAPAARRVSAELSGEDREETIPVKGVRKATSSAMVRSAYTAPHVSVWTDVDATRTMELVKRLKASADFAGIRVSPLLIMARAVIWAVRRTPMVNAAWVEQDGGAEIRVRHFVNLGIAAATPRGLLVPNVKDAQSLNMKDLARALEKLTVTAREGRTSPADQQHGTITITNIGVFGMDAGTPIINPGESGIVAMGTIRQKPWVVDGEVRPRFVTTVSGSFDHRVIDGDGMSRFIADVASVLEEPALLLD